MNEYTYLIFGVAGLLGRAMLERLYETVSEHRIFSFDHAHVDISNKEHVKELMDFIQPDIVVNCAGVSNPDICEHAQSGAFETNSIGTKILAEQCQRISAKFVHFSTADIFKGDRFQPYSERHKPKPINAYGRSNLEGETSIRNHVGDHLIIRPGWIFHAESPNFLLDWIERMDRRMVISVRPDTHGSPVFAMDLIDATIELIENDAIGIFNIANSEAATWEGLIDAVGQLVKGNAKVKPLSKNMLGHLAPSPKYTVLSTKKFTSYTGTTMRPWLSALKQCLFCMERYKP